MEKQLKPEPTLDGGSAFKDLADEFRKAKKRDRILNTIAKEVLWLDTLETQNSSGLDHFVNDECNFAVWDLKKALRKAYETGRTNGLKSVQTSGNENIAQQSWIAVVDTEKKVILYVCDNLEGQANDYRYAEINSSASDWLDSHPDYKKHLVPNDVLETLKKRFAIVDCSVSIAYDAKVWTEDEA